jgi:hypothetical protein
MRIMLWIAAILIGLIFLIWLGFQVPPGAFADPPVQPGTVERVPLPAGLPAPVERFMRTVYGDTVPVYTTVVMTGHGRIRPAGPWHLPARTRFIHETGSSYRHYIEVTWFGVPIMSVDEGYVDGGSFFSNALLGTEENEPKTAQGANLALWAEAVSFPAVLVTDPRAAWEPVDDDTALLRVPFGNETETFVVRFDPETHLITTMEVMRYHAKDSTSKTLWIPMVIAWGNGEDIFTGMEAAALWADQNGPWAFFITDAIVHNGDVSEYIRARGK